MALDQNRKKELRDAMLADMCEALNAARKALSEGDAEQLAFYAHRMKGALAIFGFASAGDLAGEIKTLAAASRLDEIEGLLSRLEQELDRIQDG